MKLSEAFAILESGKVVEFEATPTSGRRSVLYRNGKYFIIDTYNSNGEKIEFCAPAGAFNKNFSTDLDWELVRQPVTWQEALQAWADGKTISYSYMGYDKRFPFEDSNTMMSIEKIKNAEWYVD